MIELDEDEQPVEGFPYLCRMEGQCGGWVTVTMSRMEPKYVVLYVKWYGEDEFLKIWDYIPRPAIYDCQRYIEMNPQEYFSDDELP